MRIAVVGTGISGLVCAWMLHGDHEITVFEANSYIGGHTNTVDVERSDRTWAVDTGFIVFNDWTYPNFIRILDKLGVESQESSMSFSVQNETTGLEYNGTSFNSLFAQRRNLLRPSHFRMLRDVLRFNEDAKAIIHSTNGVRALNLGEFVARRGYSRTFIENYLRPIGASIWSANPEQFFDIPAVYAARFFDNHGMLNIKNRPKWRVIKGGSREYVRRMTASFLDRIRLNTPVLGVTRRSDGVDVETRDGVESFDQIVIASHSDQALRMLNNPTRQEKEVLGAIPYQPNDTVLHSDERIMPQARRAWAAWNYHVPRKASNHATITYNMNILQTLGSSEQFCVTLNRPEAIRSERVIRRFDYHHPVYSHATVGAQNRWNEINGVNRTWYCGAYWGFGFHEDGVKSALRVCEQFEKTL